MRNSSRFPITILFLSFLLFSCTPQKLAEAAASIDTPTANSDYELGEEIIVEVTISNPNNQTIRLLKWITPFEGINRSLFSVQLDGKTVSYTGILVKRSPPTEDDYLNLEAGESLSGEVDISQVYDMSQAGNYELFYDAESFQLYGLEIDEEASFSGHLVSNVLNIIIK